MPSKSKKLSGQAIAALEAKRDVGTEIMQSVKDMKAGKGKVVRWKQGRKALPAVSTR